MTRWTVARDCLAAAMHSSGSSCPCGGESEGDVDDPAFPPARVVVYDALKQAGRLIDVMILKGFLQDLGILAFIRAGRCRVRASSPFCSANRGGCFRIVVVTTRPVGLSALAA